MTTGEHVCISHSLPLIEVLWFFLDWFSTPGTTLLDKLDFPFWGWGGQDKSGLHILSHFYWVHYNLSTEIRTQGNVPTLYRPKSPRSRSTFRALTLGPVVISPATCRRIFTISNGLVKMTWEPPACRQRRDRSRFPNQSTTCSETKKKQEKHLPLHGGNDSLPLWPVQEGFREMVLNCSSQSMSGFVSTWTVKSVSQASISRANPAISKMAKLIKSFGKQKWSQMWQWGAPRERERDAWCLSRARAKIQVHNGFFPLLSKHPLKLSHLILLPWVVEQLTRLCLTEVP